MELFRKNLASLQQGRKKIKCTSEILQLLEAVQKPTQVAIMHFPEHQKGRDQLVKGNRRTDFVAKEAAYLDIVWTWSP